MKKTYKIDVDCANCANKMEDAAKNTAGVKDATVNFMTLKMSVDLKRDRMQRRLCRRFLRTVKGRGRLRDFLINCRAQE